MWKRDRLIGVLVGTLAAGILMLIFSPNITDARTSAIVQNIGMGFFVASIVGATVELYVRAQMKLQMDKMLQEIGADVFRAALKHEFPDCIWDQVSTHLLLNPVIRKNVTLDYTLEYLPNSGERFVKAQICWSYTIYNLNTTNDWSYKLAAALDRCCDPEYYNHTSFSILEVNGQPLQGDVLETVFGETLVTWKTTITLRPGEEKHITIRGESVYPIDQVVPLCMTDPTEDLTLIVSKPPNIAVVVDTMHPREQRLKELPTSSPDLRRVWQLGDGLLPGHGVIIHWFPSYT